MKMTNIFKRNTLSTLVATSMAIVLVLGSAVTVFAEVTKDGAGGKSFAGATTNTFARGMDLQEVYLDIGKTDVADTLTILKGEKIEKNGLEITLSGEHFSGKDDTTFRDQQWEYVYSGKAVFPDGTTGDVHVEFTLNSITARSTKNYEKFPAKVGLTKFDSDAPGVDIMSDIPNDSMTGEGKIAFKYFADVKVYVTGGSGTFILPVSGFNQLKGAKNAWEPFANLETVYRGESFITSADLYVTSDFPLVTATTGEYYPDPIIEGGNDNYNVGFAISSDGSAVITVGETGAKDGNTNKQKNDIFLRLGDLQHRITSGSGTGGSIATDKKGDTTGKELEGGTFDGFEFPTDTSSKDLRRYVVPDAKEKVTYSMKPESGYMMDKLKVDDNDPWVAPKDPKSGETWKYANGTITHVGGGKYTYSFDSPNAADHTIFVTWKKGPTGEDKRTIGKKGETQKGTPTFEEGTGKIPSKSAYTLLDKDGKPVDSITVKGEGKYTINKDTGEVTFVPEPNFVGEAKGVTVQVTDDQGLTATAKYIPTVVDDPVWIDGSKVKTKDTVGKTQTGRLTYKLGGSPFASVHLIDPNTGEELPEGVTEVDVYQNGKKVGTYKLNPVPIYNEDGTISFDIDFIPEGDYVGTPPPITVRVYNEYGDYADGVYQPEVLGAYENTSKKGVKTGDQTNVIIWVGILAAMAAALAAIIIRRRRRDG